MADGKLNIDFTKKSGGAVGLLATEIEETGIKFPDGNLWKKYVEETKKAESTRKCDVVKDLGKKLTEKCIVA
eukprot:8281850-Pyramimonas_sp.AAC.2